MTSPVISLRQLLLKSTLKTERTSPECQKSRSLKLDTLPDCAAEFVRRYFAGALMSAELVESFATICNDQPEVATYVFASSLRRNFPLRSSYERKVLKTLVGIFERSNMEVPNEIFEAIGECMVDAGSTSHRIFFNRLNEYVVIRENNQQLSLGTTGLSCWQASCHLANLLSLIDLSGKTIVELGAGCGLTGISVASWQLVKHACLTDFDPNVLAQLNHNILLNSERTGNRVSVETVDFLNYCSEKTPLVADVVVGADIVYDCSILSGLTKTIFEILSRKKSSFCLIASALRNETTLEYFDKALEGHGLMVLESAQIRKDRVEFDEDCSFSLPPFFPFSASVDCPTVVYLIVRRDI